MNKLDRYLIRETVTPFLLSLAVFTFILQINPLLEQARDLLAKGVPIDLHPRAFKPGDAAQTQVAHIGVLIAQIDDAPTYELLAARSFTGSLWSWLEASALEFGLEIAGGG